MRVWLALGVILLTLAACGGATPEPTPTVSFNNPAIASDPQGIIQWPRDPYHIVFRAELAGGNDTDALYRKNEIPLCTIYGDGRVVWLADVAGGTRRVWFDTLSQEVVASFISYLTVSERIFSFDEGLLYQIPTETTPVYEKLTVNVNNREHITDIFSEWEAEYFVRILGRCQTLSSTPAEFVPDGAWLSAQLVPYNPYKPVIYWSIEASGVSVRDLAANQEKKWVTDRVAKSLWQAMRDSGMDMQIQEGDLHFQIALEIPGVTISAPPPPVLGSETPEPLPAN